MAFRRGQKVLLIGDNDLFTNIGKELSTHLGIIDTKKLIGKKEGTKIKTHKGSKYTAISPTVTDIVSNLKRGPQVILPKDASLIMSISGIGKKSVVFDVGSGSGWLSVFLANHVKEVHTFEIEKRFYDIAKSNIEFAGLKNVSIKKKDVIKSGFGKRGADLITIDLKEHSKVIGHAARALNPGGWVFCHCPVIEQVQSVLKSLEKEGFSSISIIQNAPQEWKANPTRPVKPLVGHTAFLVFGRKI